MSLLSNFEMLFSLLVKNVEPLPCSQSIVDITYFRTTKQKSSQMESWYFNKFSVDWGDVAKWTAAGALAGVLVPEGMMLRTSLRSYRLPN